MLILTATLPVKHLEVETIGLLDLANNQSAAERAVSMLEMLLFTDIFHSPALLLRNVSRVSVCPPQATRDEGTDLEDMQHGVL